MSTVSRTRKPAWPAICLVIGGAIPLICTVTSMLADLPIVSPYQVSNDFIFIAGLVLGGPLMVVGFVSPAIAKLSWSSSQR